MNSSLSSSSQKKRSEKERKSKLEGGKGKEMTVERSSKEYHETGDVGCVERWRQAAPAQSMQRNSPAFQ